jgi:hypothetical protein
MKLLIERRNNGVPSAPIASDPGVRDWPIRRHRREFDGLVERCPSEHDLDGWTGDARLDHDNGR